MSVCNKINKTKKSTFLKYCIVFLNWQHESNALYPDKNQAYTDNVSQKTIHQDGWQLLFYNSFTVPNISSASLLIPLHSRKKNYSELRLCIRIDSISKLNDVFLTLKINMFDLWVLCTKCLKFKISVRFARAWNRAGFSDNIIMWNL